MDAEIQTPKDTTGTEDTEQIELLVGGMTCASCAGRVERRLNKMEGVTASVNLPLERATVKVPAGVTAEQLIAEVEKAGYQARLPEPPRPVGEAAPDPVDHEGIKVAGLKRRFGLSAALAIPVILLSMVPPLQFDAWQWLAFAMAGPVVLWGGWPFHVTAVRNLRHGTASMDTLISVGTVAAYLWSIWSLFLGDAGNPTMRMGWHFFGATGGDEIYLEAAAGVVAFILAGRWLEARAKRSAGAALRALLELGAKEVAVLRDGREERIPADALQVGDRFVVRPGEKVATDGVVEDGSSAIDASLLTGESVPVEVAPGASVIGATVNVGGRLVIRATRVGADTKLAQISRLVSDAQAGKAQVQRLADRISAVFVPVVIALAVGTLGAWLGAGGTANAAFTAAVAVLIIACPCALGLATPTALLVGTGRGAQLGILIKGPEVLESTQRIDTVVLDKTGTVTTGRMSLVAVVAGEGEDEGEALRLAGALEDASEHPIAQAVAAAARERHGDLPPVESFENKRGLGVQGVVEGHAVVAGRPSLLADWGAPLPQALQGPMADAEARGQTVIAVAWDGKARAVLAVADTVKATSAAAVVSLRELGLEPILLTGDNEAVAKAIAAEVGIDTVIAGVLPEQKVDEVRRLQAEGRRVAMVGDGVNDAAALAAADLGLAMGTGTDAAIEASDLTLVSGDLLAAADGIRLARRVLKTIRGNLFWAFAYNVAAIPLAAAGLLNPMLAGAAMAFSSVFVVTNSLRLRTFRSQVAGGTGQAEAAGKGPPPAAAPSAGEPDRTVGARPAA